MGTKHMETEIIHTPNFARKVRTEEGFIVPDIGTYVKVTRRIVKLKVSHDKTYETESFNGVVVDIYPYQIAVHRIGKQGVPLRGNGSVVYLRAQEIHMQKSRKHQKQVLEALEEISVDELKEDVFGITAEDIIDYWKLIPHRTFTGYEVGEYVAVEEKTVNERKAKRYILRITDKRDNILVGMEYRYGRVYMFRYILALQMESGDIKLKKVSEKVALSPHTYEEMALDKI